MRSLVSISGLILGMSAAGVLGYGTAEVFRKDIWESMDYLIVAISFALLSQILMTLARE